MTQLSYVSLFRLRQLVRTSRTTPDTVSVRSFSGTMDYTYSRTRLFTHRAKLAILLSQVTDSMKQSSGQPDYWMHARYDYAGRVWTTDLSDADELLAMGRALGYVSVLDADPDASCDMPRVLILDRTAAEDERQLPLHERNRRLSSWSFAYLRKPLVSSPK